MKRVAIDEGVDSGCLDAVIDSSEGLGLKPNAILYWSNPNNGPGGRATDVVCRCSFRLIAASDDGPFKDLLLIPDFLGNIALKKTAGMGPGYEQAKKEVTQGSVTFYCWSYLLRRANEPE